MRKVGAIASLMTALLAPAAGSYQVERWSSTWHGYADDFEDGVLPDGDPGEPDAYEGFCGALDDDAEAGGRIRLELPNAACTGGVSLAPKILLGRDTTLRVRFAPTQLTPGSFFAMVLGNQSLSQRITLMIVRDDLLGPGSDAVGAALYYNFTALEGLLLSGTPDAFLAGTGSIEIELSTRAGPQGDTAVPHARVRICALAGCTSSDLFVDLLDGPGAPPGAVAAGQRLQVSFGLNAPGGGIADVLDWSVTTHFEDEFDGALTERAPYAGQCLDGATAGGALSIDLTGPSCSIRGGFTAAVTSPAPATTQATFAFAVPPPCSDAFAIGLGADRELVAEPDGAMAWLSRGPIPGIGDDVLYVALEADAPYPTRPWLGLHVLSTTPDSFGAGVDSIEMRLEDHVDPFGGPVTAHASVRTCAGRDCAGAPFADLQPFSFPQADPDLVVCGARAADRAPPLDGGAMDPDAARISYLVFAPEPDGALVAGVAICVALARRRRRPRAARPR